MRRCLSKLNIVFDIDTINAIHSFLRHYVGSISDENLELSIYAAAAIVSETRKIATVDKKSLTTNGIKVEMVMKNLSRGVSK